MRLHRPLLYAGAFFVAIGGTILLADSGRVDTATLTSIVRLWPLAIIAIGLALVLRRTPLNVAGGLLAVTLPAVMLGSGIGVLPHFAGDCGAPGAPGEVVTDTGELPRPGHVAIDTGCGTLVVQTSPGPTWTLRSSSTGGHLPNVDATGDGLFINDGATGIEHLTHGRDVWDVTLPMGSYEAISFIVRAGHGSIDLGGTSIGSLELVATLSDVDVDLTSTTFADLSASANLGHVSLRLPSGRDASASLYVGVGSMQVCVPEGAALHIATSAKPGEV